MRRHGVAGVGVGIDAHAASAGRVVKLDAARARLEVIERILGVDRGIAMAWYLSFGSRIQCESFSPAATLICSFTRSMPYASSVMVCSTWMRVFISMK